jgi:hypothetical protein
MIKYLFAASLVGILGCQNKVVKKPGDKIKESKTSSTELQMFVLADQTLKTLSDGSAIRWGGFSGLQFIKKEDTGELLFWTLTDRGPNLDEVEKEDGTYRPFLWPDFHPSFVKIRLDKKTGLMEVIESIPFKNTSGEFINGLPPENSAVNPEHYEIAVDTQGQLLQNNGLGVDSESLAVDEQQHFWVGEEYEPSILEFDPNGTLITHIKPAPKDGVKLKKNQLPFDYNFRKLNRGFEALGYFKNKIYFMTQSPLESEEKSNWIRIGVFNTKTRKYEAEYLYELKNRKVNKIGDLQMINDKQFFVIEQNGETNSESVHNIYQVDFSKATNLVKKPLKKRPELVRERNLPRGFKFVEKTLVIDMVQEGYSEFEKVEGLAMIDSKTLAVINDNDFGIVNGKLGMRPSVMGIFKLK